MRNFSFAAFFQATSLLTQLRILTLCGAVLAVLAGCSAVGVIATNDPHEKLAQAREVERLGRISVARRLRLEAIEMFEQRGDKAGLAEGYRQYAFHLRQYDEDVIRLTDTSGKLPELKNVKASMDKSIVYFKKSLALVEADRKWDKASNLYFNIGISHYHAKRTSEACQSFDKSLAVHERYLQANPNANIDLPENFSSFSEMIAWVKEDNQCP